MNALAPDTVTDPDFSGQWLYEPLADILNDTLDDPEAEANFRANGFFALNPYSGLKIININNNFGTSMNMFVYMDLSDPGDQLAWFVDEMMMAEKNQEKVRGFECYFMSI